MSNYKLYYFPARGRAEPVRLLFAYKGIKYEDVRLGGEKWLEFKSKTPFGSMPVLEEDGKMLGGSLVILRYLGEKEGLAGSNDWENAQIANIADFVNDFLSEILKTFFEKDEGKAKELAEKIKNETGPKYLGKLNEIAGNNNGYLFGGCLTWVDLSFFCIYNNMVKQHPEVAGLYPNLTKLKTNVESNPGVAKWLAERPESSF